MLIKFYNSTAGGAFWAQMLGGLEQDGYQVEHSWAIDSRSYGLADTVWGRIQKTWKMYPWYCMKSLFGEGADVHVATTNPFCNPALVCWRYGGRGHTVNLLYDLFPDALELSGMVKRGGCVSRVLSSITCFSLHRSSATVFLGERLKQHVERRYGVVNNPQIIPVGADGSSFAGSAPRMISENETIQLMYCGNMGRAHDTDTLVKYMKNKFAGEVAFRFHAKGRGYEAFRNCLGDFTNPYLYVNSPLSENDWVSSMKSVHIGIITMKQGWENVVMPSKAYSALVAGQAILAICPIKSDLADLIRKHECGWIVEPGDVDGLANTIQKIRRNPMLVHEKRLNAFTAGHRFYDSKVVACQWVDLFEALMNE